MKSFRHTRAVLQEGGRGEKERQRFSKHKQRRDRGLARNAVMHVKRLFTLPLRRLVTVEQNLHYMELQ